MTAKTLEEEAKEYATRIRPCKYKIIDYDKEQPKRWREVYEAYLAAATLRDKEIEELRAKLASMREPIWMLREEHDKEIEELRARVKELEGMVPKLVTNKEFEKYAGRWWLVATFGHYGDLLLIVPMSQPIPLPGEKEG